MELHAAAEEAAAWAAATLAKAAAAAAADRAALARAASDRELARETLLLRHRQESVQIKRQSLAGNISERSNIPGHGGDAQPMPND